MLPVDPLIMISTGPDGPSICRIDGDELAEQLLRGDYGENPRFLEDIPDDPDLNAWPEGHLLLMARVAVPAPIQVATKWEVRRA